MPKILERSIRELRERADLVAIVSARVNLKKAGGDLVGLCPFHEERSPSFHVHPAKGFFKCFGCGRGGDVFNFVMESEGLKFAEAVRVVAERSFFALEFEGDKRPVGGERAVAGDGAALSPGMKLIAVPEGVDEGAAKRAMRRQQRYEAARAAEVRAVEAWLEAWRPKVQARRIGDWSDLVRERFESGEATEARVARLGAERGWPERWVWWLVEEGLLRWPLPPWAERDRDGMADEPAFRVDRPAMVKRDGVWRCAGVKPVGYHQRYIREEGGKRKKQWRFVPNFPAERDADGGILRLSGFKRGLRAECLARGLPEGESVLPALPFVMGNVVGARRFVFAEGQWDAVTFAGACGWLESESSWPEDVVVMGARGASSVEVLLAFWGEWLEAGPVALVLADNDAAGRRWDTASVGEWGSRRGPTFAERLRRRPGDGGAEGDWVELCRRVEILRVRPEFGKDFNDYWRARRPTAEQMAGLLAAHGLDREQLKGAA